MLNRNTTGTAGGQKRQIVSRVRGVFETVLALTLPLNIDKSTLFVGFTIAGAYSAQVPMIIAWH